MGWSEWRGGVAGCGRAFAQRCCFLDHVDFVVHVALFGLCDSFFHDFIGHSLDRNCGNGALVSQRRRKTTHTFE